MAQSVLSLLRRAVTLCCQQETMPVSSCPGSWRQELGDTSHTLECRQTRAYLPIHHLVASPLPAQSVLERLMLAATVWDAAAASSGRRHIARPEGHKNKH